MAWRSGLCPPSSNDDRTRNSRGPTRSMRFVFRGVPPASGINQEISCAAPLQLNVATKPTTVHRKAQARQRVPGAWVERMPNIAPGVGRSFMSGAPRMPQRGIGLQPKIATGVVSLRNHDRLSSMGMWLHTCGFPQCRAMTTIPSVARTKSKLPLTFKPLTTEGWCDLEKLFGERGACGGCWCMSWRLHRARYEKQKGPRNKAAFREIVSTGPPPGATFAE